MQNKFLKTIILALLFISGSWHSSVIAAKIIESGKTPVLSLKGKNRPFIVAREHVSYSAAKQKYLKKVYKAGVKIYWQAWTVPFVEKKGKVLTANLKTLSKRIQGVLRAGDDSMIILQIRTTLKVRQFKGWLDQNPDHVAVWPPDMRKGDRASAVSSKVLSVQKRSMVWLAEYLSAQSYANRIAGVVICGGNGEWMDYWDFSKPAQQDFKQWITKRYSGDLAKLRQAWNDHKITFDQVTIPAWKEIMRGGDVGIFYDPTKSGKLIDFLIYHRTRLGDIAIEFAKAFRKGSKNTIPVGMWGGGYQPGSPSKNLFYRYGKGRNPSANLVSSPEFDFFINPYNYRERHCGGMFFQPVSSYALYGKMILCEEDTRTYITPPYKKYASWEKLGDNFGQAKTPEDTANVLKRNFAGVFTHPGAGISYFSLGGGFWFNSDKIINTFADLTKVAQQVFEKNDDSAEVAIILNSASFSYQSMNNFNQLYSKLAIEMARTGVPLDIYQLTDITAKNFPVDKYKVYVFFDMSRISAEEKAAIDSKLKGNNRTLMWFYAPGFVTDKGLSIKNSSDVTGINLKTSGKHLSLDFGLSMYLTNFNSKLLKDIPKGTRCWTDLQVYPVIWAEDPQAVVLGEALASDRQIATYRKSGICVKKFKDWTSVWSAVPIMPVSLFRNVFKEAGVHIYTSDGAQVFTGQGIFALHASTSGEHKISFPKKYKITDPMSGKEISSGTDHITVQLKQGDTILWTLK